MAAFVAIAMAGPVRAATPLPAPAPDRVLYDEANVMAPADAEAVDRIAAELAAKTGVSIVVVTVPRLVDETIDELAVRVGHGWGVGRRGEDRGVVIALSIGDRKIHVATGYGAEEILNDAKVGRLIDERAAAALREDHFSTAIAELVRGIAAEAARHAGVELDTAPVPATSSWVADIGTTLLTILGALVRGYLAVRHPRLLLAWLLFARPSGGRRSGGRGGGGAGFGGGGFGGGGAGRDF